MVIGNLIKILLGVLNEHNIEKNKIKNIIESFEKNSITMLGGECLYIPKTKPLIKSRNKTINTNEKAKTIAELAEENGVTKRRIYQIMNGK